MAQTHDFGPFFVHRINLRPDAPRFSRATTQEIDPPYRRSNPVVVRLVRGFGIVLGRWRKTGMTEDEALLTALGRETDLDPLIERWDEENSAEAVQ
jgi:hypothetical protein